LDTHFNEQTPCTGPTSGATGALHRSVGISGTRQTKGETAVLRLGYKASAEQFGPRQLLEFAVAAEGAGFDSVVISDHFTPWRHTNGHAPFSFTWLGALGERTTRVTIGTSVVAPTFRYHPSVVAQAMATLGTMYPKRVLLGVGTGESMNEVTSTGLEWPETPVRFARLKEAVELMQQLWRRDFVTYEGEHFRTHDATLYDRPDTPIPLYIAASGPAAARLAGRVADGFICTSGKGMELYRDTLLPAVRQGKERAGRGDEVELMIEMKVSFDHDRRRALEDCKIWAALALPGEQKMGVHDPRDMEQLAQSVLGVAHRRWLVSDSVDEHLEQLSPYLDLGFTHLVFHAPGDDQRRFIDLYANEVLPRIREWRGLGMRDRRANE
jgi:coenzyme F420-dependent glucose-6-phosphate dehydrogenase